jgi:hypothetical protein
VYGEHNPLTRLNVLFHRIKELMVLRASVSVWFVYIVSYPYQLHLLALLRPLGCLGQSVSRHFFVISQIKLEYHFWGALIKSSARFTLKHFVSTRWTVTTNRTLTTVLRVYNHVMHRRRKATLSYQKTPFLKTLLNETSM